MKYDPTNRCCECGCPVGAEAEVERLRVTIKNALYAMRHVLRGSDIAIAILEAALRGEGE